MANTDRRFKAIESKQFIKNNFYVVNGEVYDLELLQKNIGNNSIIKYFREELTKTGQLAEYKVVKVVTKTIIKREYKGKTFHWKTKIENHRQCWCYN